MASILHTISDQKSSLVDIVFVHGLGGHFRSTWQEGGLDQRDSWPEWLASAESRASVHSLQYEAQPSGWLGSSLPIVDIATEILTVLETTELGERPIVWITHSLGGLIVKQILRHAEDQPIDSWRKISANTRSIIFLATPHAGSNLADWLVRLSLVLRTTPATRDLISHDHQLSNLNDWFRTKATEKGLRVHSFFETKKTRGAVVVDRTSADPGLPNVVPRPVERADHLSICKPVEDNDFRVIYSVKEIRRVIDVELQPTDGDNRPTNQTNAGRQCQVSPPRLPYTRGKFIGRTAEIDMLDSLMSDKRSNIVVIQAAAGTGKTALVKELLSKYAEKNWKDYDTVFEWSFYNQGIDNNSGGSDVFFEYAAKFFKLSTYRKSALEIGGELASVIAAQKALIVLDGVETTQYTYGPHQGRVRDVGLESFLVLLARSNLGCCIVTTRVLVVDLENYVGRSVDEIVLEELKEGDSIELLKNIGVIGDDEDIAAASKSVGFNPFALRLLGNWLRYEHDGDARRYSEVQLLEEDASQGGHAHRMMQKYHSWLPQEDLQVLSIVGFFERPGREEELFALIVVLKEFDSFQMLRSFDRGAVLRTLSRLQEIGLLNDNDTNPFEIDAHPLIKGYERKILHNQPDAWLLGNRILYNLTLDKIRKLPKHKSEFFELYEAVAYGVNAGIYNEVWTDVVEKMLWQGDYFSTSTLGLVSAELGMVRRFFLKPFKVPNPKLSESTKAQLISQTGFLLSSTLQFDEAIEVQEYNFSMRSEQEAWLEASIAAGSASEYCLVLGNLDKARALVNESIKVSALAGDPRWIVAGYSLAGYINYELGLKHDSEVMFSLAEDNFRKISRDDWIGRASGFNILMCRLDELEHKIWVCCGQEDYSDLVTEAEQLRAWSVWCLRQNENADQKILLYNGFFSLSLGRAETLVSFLKSSNFDLAQMHLDDSIKFFTQSGIERFDPLSHIYLAALIRWRCMREGKMSTSQLESYQNNIEQAERIIRFGPMIRYRLLSMVEQCRQVKNGTDLLANSAKSELIENAIELATWHKFRRLLDELEDIRG